MLLSLIEQDPASISSSAAVDQLDRSLPVVELPPPSPNGRGGGATGSAAAVAGEQSQPAMMPQQQRGFTALQALVQRGGLAEMQRVLTLRDDDDDGFLTMHDMRAVLTDPTARNQAASATAAGWPTVDGADYRRMAYLPDYRRLQIHRESETPKKNYHLSSTELDDVALLAARDVTGRKVNYRELVERKRTSNPFCFAWGSRRFAFLTEIACECSWREPAGGGGTEA